MMRLICLLLVVLGSGVWAQEAHRVARIDASKSQVRDRWGGMQVELRLSEAVPYRVFTLEAPRRLVIDFRDVDWSGVTRDGLLAANFVEDLRFGVLRPGWSRMVVDLAAPLVVTEAGLRVADDGSADLKVVLKKASDEAFATRAGAPDDQGWGALMATDPTVSVERPDDAALVVVIDPGHGGIDPGADRGGVQEADIMLHLGQEVAEALNQITGVRAYLTRETDIFVPLEERMTIARAAGADLMISLHADALDEDEARGASVYTLSDKASDAASARMAAWHERGDLLAGLDLSENDDRVATVLMDLARLETGPQSERFANALVQTMRDSGVRMNSRPRREGLLAVLHGADFASVLVETGFLSNERDRAALSSVLGRKPYVRGLVEAVQVWSREEAARAPLIRQ